MPGVRLAHFVLNLAGDVSCCLYTPHARARSPRHRPSPKPQGLRPRLRQMGKTACDIILSHCLLVFISLLLYPLHPPPQMAGSCCFPYDCFVPQPQPHLRLSLPLVCLPRLMMPDPQLWHFQMAAASPAPPDTCMHFPTMFLLSL